MQLRGSLCSLVRLAAASLLASGLVPAQSYYGGLRGLVTDQASSAVAAAKVTLTDQGTGTARSTISTAEGEFVFTQVVPGTFTVSVEHPGFKRFDRTGVIIATQQQITLDVKLELGQVTQTVEVNEDVPLVEASNASQGQVLDNQKLVELPNLGRNPFMMSKLSANIVQVGPPSYNRMQDQSGSSMISVAGGPVRGNNYLIDGIPITDANNRAVIIPSLEAVQEVKVQANTYDAEMARTGGGMFNTYMKSGTNDYHGSLYGHLRETSWDANFFFNNAAGLPLAEQPNKTYGASFGGAVKVPKVYDGKNKTFFWLAWEGYNDTQANSSAFSTPTALERVGDFSQSFAKGGGLQTVYDPLSTVQNADGSYTRMPFTGNVIPTQRLNTVGLNIAKTYVLPTSTAAYYGAPNLNASTTLPSHAAQYTGKLDHQVTNWWHASVSYLRYFSLEPGNTWFPSISSPDQWRLQRRVDATQVNNLLTVSPSTVIAVRYGMNRFPNYGYQASQNFNLASLGFSSGFVSQVPSQTFPNVGMTSQYSLGTNNNFYYVHASRSFSTSVSHFRGRHSLKAGFDYRRIKADGNDFGDSSGNFQFNNVFTRSTPLSNNVNSGSDLADLLLGYPTSGTGYVPTKLRDYADYYAVFVQDDFRLSSKLTVNYGVRWEREYGLAERNNGLVVGFDRQAVNPLGAGVTGILPKGVVELAGINGHPTTVGNPNMNKFGPRVGVAWQVTPKTVVRGGYGIFWAPQFGIGSPLNPPGYTATTSYIATVDGFATPVGSLTDPFPGGLAMPVGNTRGDLTATGQSLSLVDPNARSPRVQQYSLDVQRELPGGVALEVGYVGSHTTHLTLGTSNININALSTTNFALGSALNNAVPNPFYGNGGTGIIGTASVQRYQLLLPYPTFGAVNLQFSDQNHARYDSLILKAQKRLSAGLSLLSTLTYSRNMDASSGGPGNSLNGGNAGPQNPYDMAAEYSRSNVDTPLRWASAVTYELPFGKGKPFASKPGIVNYVVGGWTVNAVSTFQSGFPLQVTQSSNLNSAFGYASQRPNATGVSAATSGDLASRLNGYVNPAAFSQAPQFTFGNISRTLALRGPGTINYDLSVFKNFVIKERLKAQFRAEGLNAFNTPQFSAPNTSFGSSSFGYITSQQNFPRQLQLALRFSF
jgi:hypothetical protein